MTMCNSNYATGPSHPHVRQMSRFSGRTKCCRHKGQAADLCLLAHTHSSKQPRWKSWPHGVRHTSSPRERSAKQITHCEIVNSPCDAGMCSNGPRQPSKSNGDDRRSNSSSPITQAPNSALLKAIGELRRHGESSKRRSAMVVPNKPMSTRCRHRCNKRRARLGPRSPAELPDAPGPLPLELCPGSNAAKRGLAAHHRHAVLARSSGTVQVGGASTFSSCWVQTARVIKSS